jgi:hypothetical protein
MVYVTIYRLSVGHSPVYYVGMHGILYPLAFTFSSIRRPPAPAIRVARLAKHVGLSEMAQHLRWCVDFYLDIGLLVR